MKSLPIALYALFVITAGGVAYVAAQGHNASLESIAENCQAPHAQGCIDTLSQAPSFYPLAPQPRKNP